MRPMPAHPRERLSQRRLVYELRVAIDRVRNAQTASTHTSALKEVERLVDQNPSSVQSRFVIHNLGAARRAWLADFTTTRGAPAATSSHSSPTR